MLPPLFSHIAPPIDSAVISCLAQCLPSDLCHQLYELNSHVGDQFHSLASQQFVLLNPIYCLGPAIT